MSAPWMPRPLPTRLSASPHAPLVGRNTELALFQTLWSDVEQGRRQLVLVGGEPGAGKTRLVAEVARVLDDDDVPVLVGTSSADAGIPYQPFSEMLDDAFGGVRDSTMEALL